MKMTIDIDCTPEEARRLFGLPDVSSINDLVVDEMARRAKENLDTLADPERFVAQWMDMSGRGFEQFQSLMGAAMKSATTDEKSKK
ncbi:MAG: DUF6489 family protein [Pseudomonadota bacterium]